MNTRVPKWLRSIDQNAIDFVRRHGITVLRGALALVFLWFGVLKVAGVSPVADLVARTLPFLDPNVAVRSVGSLEIVIGLGLLTGWAIRITMLLFFAQMLATFSVLVLEPGLSFVNGNPLLLTVTGEFVIKNIVLIGAGLLVAGSMSPAKPRDDVAEMLTKRLD